MQDHINKVDYEDAMKIIEEMKFMQKKAVGLVISRMLDKMLLTNKIIEIGFFEGKMDFEESIGENGR